MRFKMLLLPLVMVALFFPSLCFSDRPDPKIWEPLGHQFYYNKKIITKSPGILLVWTYKTVTDDIRRARMDEVRKYAPEKSAQYLNYHHEAVLWEMDCSNRRFKMNEIIDFDKNGKALDRYRYDQTTWHDIVPGSGGQKLYHDACMPKKKQPPKKKTKKIRRR